MKRIFIMITCVALLAACGESKKEENKQSCDKTKCEQRNCDKQDCKKDGCEKQECKKDGCKEQECDKQECKKDRCKKQECDKQECKKDRCKKQECDKQECKKKPAGCIHLDAEGFAKSVADLTQPEWKYLGDKPAVVDFYADWCGPCRAIAPYLEEIAKEYAGKLYVYKINVDNNPELADAFNVTGIPTLLFIPMEGQYTVQVGGKSKEELEQLIAENCF